MAKNVRDYRLYIEDISGSIKKIKVYVKGMSIDKYPGIEWESMIAFRNVIIHEYFGINLKIMWDIIKNELPALERGLRKIGKEK